MTPCKRDSRAWVGPSSGVEPWPTTTALAAAGAGSGWWPPSSAETTSWPSASTAGSCRARTSICGGGCATRDCASASHRGRLVEHRFAGDDFTFAKDQFLMDGAGLGRMVRTRRWRGAALALLPAAAAVRGSGWRSCRGSRSGSGTSPRSRSGTTSAWPEGCEMPVDKALRPDAVRCLPGGHSPSTPLVWWPAKPSRWGPATCSGSSPPAPFRPRGGRRRGRRLGGHAVHPARPARLGCGIDRHARPRARSGRRGPRVGSRRPDHSVGSGSRRVPRGHRRPLRQPRRGRRRPCVRRSFRVRPPSSAR